MEVNKKLIIDIMKITFLFGLRFCGGIWSVTLNLVCCPSSSAKLLASRTRPLARRMSSRRLAKLRLKVSSLKSKLQSIISWSDIDQTKLYWTSQFSKSIPLYWIDMKVWNSFLHANSTLPKLSFNAHLPLAICQVLTLI